MDTILNAALILAVGHLMLGVILWLRVRKLYCYPGYLGVPVFGNIYYFYRTLFLGSMNSMDNHMERIAEKYGKNGLCFHWIYGFRTSVIVSSPRIVKEIAFHSNLVDKCNLMYTGFLPYSGGPFSTSRSDGLWKLKRKEYDSCLKKSHVEREYIKTFIKCAEKLIESILASPSDVDVLYQATGITQNATVETLFDVETSIVYHPAFIKAMTLAIDIGSFIWANPKLARVLLTILRYVDGIFFRKLFELRQLIIKQVERNIAMEKCPTPEKSLSMKIASRSIKCNGSKETFINELQELFFTSSQPLTSAIAHSLVFFALLPDIQDRAWQEQYEIFGNDTRDPTMEDARQMMFLDRFIKESLRFLGPPFIGKLTNEDMNIDGTLIPKGTSVIFLMRYMRMDPKYWKNPKVFDPDRFLEEKDLFKYSYTPFGIGIRNCPGMYFATFLIKITLSKILRRLKIRPVQEDFCFEDLRYKSCVMVEVVNAPLLRFQERSS